VPVPHRSGSVASIPLRFDTVTFLSDFGHADEHVGIVYSVIRAIAPDVAVVDLTHEVAPFDVRGGGLLLARSAQYLCPGVVMAVVDPGTPTDRRALAVEVGDGMSILVGPDNGLLAPAVAMCGGATRAVELTNPAWHLESAGSVAAGRDIFAPVAAHLCTGVPLDELGPDIDPALLMPGVLPVARTEDDELVAEVLWVDRFGNAQLNVDPDELDLFAGDDPVQLAFDGTSRVAMRVSSPGGVGTGQVGLLTDGYGMVAVVVDRGSAAGDLGLGPSTEVRLRRVDDAGGQGATGSVTTPVTLGGRQAREDTT
jgi:S-adenosyl-L-methionine hydrolase (adenosine-forming)